jgi:hypothetical protein
MMILTVIPPTQQADRLAIRELVDAYARGADRRDADGQKALFTPDTRFVVYMDGQGSEPTQVIDGREGLTPVFENLNRYQATQHSTVRAPSRWTATGRPARAIASPTTCSPRMTGGS